jgi:hypothetical protein
MEKEGQERGGDDATDQGGLSGKSEERLPQKSESGPQDDFPVIANTALCRLLGVSMQEIEGEDIFSLEAVDLSTTDLSSKLNKALQENRDFETASFAVETLEGKRTMSIQGRVVRQGKGQRPYRILLHFKET